MSIQEELNQIIEKWLDDNGIDCTICIHRKLSRFDPICSECVNYKSSVVINFKEK